MMNVIIRKFGTTKIDLKLNSLCTENNIPETVHDIVQLLSTVGYKYYVDSNNSRENGKHTFTISNDHSLEFNISTIKENGYEALKRRFQESISKTPAPNVEVYLSELIFTRMDANLSAGIIFNRDGSISTCYNTIPLVHTSSRESMLANSKLFEIIVPSQLMQSSTGSNGCIFSVLDYIGAIPVREKYPGIYFIQPAADNPSSTDAVYIRTFPTRTMSLIVQVPNLLEVQEKLRSLSLSTPLLLESIGGRASYGILATPE